MSCRHKTSLAPDGGVRVRRKSPMNSIFSYTDYRKFLSDFYLEKKTERKSFSYRFIASKVGFKSAGHFTQIITGKANISIVLIERFAEFLKLKKREAEYFQCLVLFNQAKNHEDKKRYFDKMTSFREATVRVVDAAQYEFYDKWYYTAIHELLDFYKFRGDYKELGRQIEPSIPPAEAQRSIELLASLGFIKKDAHGYYRKTSATITTGNSAPSLAVNSFVLNSLKLSAEAIDRFPRDERNLSWLTMSLSQESYNEVVEELRAFRRRALDIASQDSAADRVYQFNFQVFPLSRKQVR
jgi:uncharacterized protein (TIGR02147 family)